jgi:acylphosphatase
MNWFTGRSAGQRHAPAEEQQTGPDAEPTGPAVRLTAWVHGMVQGVGFRWWTRSRALELGLVGSAKNLLDGRVEVVVEGPRSACDDLLRQLRAAGTPGRVEHVEATFSAARGELRGFVER